MQINRNSGITANNIYAMGCAALVAYIAVFVGFVAVIAYALKWVIN